MKPALALTLLLLAASAFMLGRNLFTTIKGKTPATWVTWLWLWLGLWAVAVLYGLGSAVPRWLTSGESSALLAIGVAVVAVFCQTRIWGHMMARANYAPHGQETVIRGTEVVGGSDLQARMYGDKAKPADVDMGWSFRACWKRSTCFSAAPRARARRRRLTGFCGPCGHAISGP